MIKFFKHIRKDLMETGKTGKYLKYAIGKIVLLQLLFNSKVFVVK
jgi:hypothetical protein